MIDIGKYNTLEVLKNTPIGLYLGDGSEEVLLPKRYVPGKIKTGDQLEVFVYLDSENRPVATTLKPFATVDEFAFLMVKEINEHGAFFDWGIDKDVFAPYSEQTEELQTGRKYIVFIYTDERSGRIAASLKWNQFADDSTHDLIARTEVQLLIAQQTALGYKAIINNQYEGLLYENEIFEPLNIGDVRRGFIKQVREDGKIDLSLQQQGYGHIEDLKQLLLQELKDHKGILPLGDKSSP
ncbi:MAG TPA: S1-like domain-containing RNA-binding protein, partial [Bacteroidia bacterium]|nr:S1-like domain-containing RNA-binding protein [Bacteroidia bacterium]